MTDNKIDDIKREWVRALMRDAASNVTIHSIIARKLDSASGCAHLCNQDLNIPKLAAELEQILTRLRAAHLAAISEHVSLIPESWSGYDDNFIH